MEATSANLIDSVLGHLKLVTVLPSTPTVYYGAHTIKNNQWRGGEIVYHNGSGTGAQKIYIQTASSGTTPTWRKTIQFEVYP